MSLQIKGFAATYDQTVVTGRGSSWQGSKGGEQTKDRTTRMHMLRMRAFARGFMCMCISFQTDAATSANIAASSHFIVQYAALPP